MYDTNRDDELNGDFGMTEHNDNSDNDNKEHTPREKGKPIKNNKKYKPSLLIVKKSPLKETHTKKIKEEDNDETMDTSCNKDKDENEWTNIDSEPSTLDSINTSQAIDSNEETETREKIMEYYY